MAQSNSTIKLSAEWRPIFCMNTFCMAREHLILSFLSLPQPKSAQLGSTVVWVKLFSRVLPGCKDLWWTKDGQSSDLSISEYPELGGVIGLGQQTRRATFPVSNHVSVMIQVGKLMSQSPAGICVVPWRTGLLAHSETTPSSEQTGSGRSWSRQAPFEELYSKVTGGTIKSINR